MGKYTPAAHKAAMVAEQQADQLPCIVPSNNLLYCFLREVRIMRIAAANESEDPYSDNLAHSLKTALDSLQEFPLRVYDAKSAQEVKGIGPAMANIIRDELFAAYPPEEPSEAELQQLQNARAALRVAQAAKKRRNVIANAPPSLPAQIRRTSFDHESPINFNTNNNMPGTSAAAATAAAAAKTTTTAAGRGRGRSAPTATYTAPGADYNYDNSGFTAPSSHAAALDYPVPKPSKAKKPYTPGIGTANYAFLIVLLQAQRGPEKMEFLTKIDLSTRTEASGLSDKPINPEPIPRVGFNNQNARQFYSGWSNFKKLVNEGLVTEYSNPKKIKLTFEGLALAERLYRDAVARGKASPVPGLASDGPLQFQLEERSNDVGAAAVAARAAQDTAGLIPGALPSAALRRPSSLNRTASGSGPGSGLPSLGRNGSVGGAAAAYGGGVYQSGAVTAAVAAAAAAAIRRASGEGSSSFPWQDGYNSDDNDDDDPLEMPLAQRLTSRGRGQGRGRGRGKAQPASRLGTVNNNNTAAANKNNIGVQGNTNDPLFLDLAGDSSNDEDNNEYSPAEERNEKRKKHRVSDEHVAMMMEMGFSDKKARKALRKSLGNIENAVDIVTVMSSAGEEESSSDEEVEERRKEKEGRVRAAPGATTNTTNRIIHRATAAAGAAAAAAAAGVPLSRHHLPGGTGVGIGTNLNIGTAGTNGRGHIRTGSQPTSRPRLDPNSQSQPDYLTSSQPTAGGAGAGPQQQHQQNYQQENKNWWVQESDIRLPPLPTGRTFSEEYEVVLLVDGREQYSRNTGGGTGASRTDALQAHLTRMRGAGLAVEHRTLPIGDALWVARSRRTPSTEYVLDYILERKSLTDLLSSIKDSNRYTSQKYFLNRCGLHNLYYLIEGDVEILPNPREVKTIKTAAGSTEIIDGFRVLRTKGVQETFRLYQSLTEAVVQLYSNLTNRSNTSNTTMTLTFDAFKIHMREVNQGSTTVHDIWGRMLVEIPGLGPEGAAAILSAYPVPKLLWNAYRRALQDGIASGRGGAVVAEELLVGIRGENGGRALGPDKAKKVFQALFMNHWNLQRV